MYEAFLETKQTPFINSISVDGLYMSSMLPSDKYQVLYVSDSKLTPRWFYKGIIVLILHLKNAALLDSNYLL
jgi:hypothetical protein